MIWQGTHARCRRLQILPSTVLRSHVFPKEANVQHILLTILNHILFKIMMNY